jgi:hypothetical protein
MPPMPPNGMPPMLPRPPNSCSQGERGGVTVAPPQAPKPRQQQPAEPRKTARSFQRNTALLQRQAARATQQPQP